MANDKVIVPVKMDKDYKNMLLKHCAEEGLFLSGLIRKLLREYVEREGIEK